MARREALLDAQAETSHDVGFLLRDTCVGGVDGKGEAIKRRSGGGGHEHGGRDFDQPRSAGVLDIGMLLLLGEPRTARSGTLICGHGWPQQALHFMAALFFLSWRIRHLLLNKTQRF